MWIRVIAVATIGAGASAYATETRGDLDAKAALELRFGNWLLDRHEPLRAVGSFQRLRFLAGEAGNRCLADLSLSLEAVADQRAGRAAGALSIYQNLFGSTKDASFAGRIQLNAALAHLSLGDVGEARSEITAVKGTVLAQADARFHLQATFYSALVGAAAGDWHASQSEYGVALDLCKSTPDSDKTLCAAAARNLIITNGGPTHRSPVVAGTLAALFPGAGMLFAGSRIDALTYFVLTGLTTSVAYDVYDRHERWGGQKASFYLMAGLAGLIHLSSIIGSYNMAVRANESATHRTLENMTVDPFPSPDPALPDGWRRAEVPDCR